MTRSHLPRRASNGRELGHDVMKDIHFSPLPSVFFTTKLYACQGRGNISIEFEIEVEAFAFLICCKLNNSVFGHNLFEKGFFFPNDSTLIVKEYYLRIFHNRFILSI